ncbi:TPR repeat-containing protein [Rippkaea orientalis PCC 8801]|uniref:TPR repeat-containing protein n=1 Tax=Rippkaea orientalis (strain PCC 8801 / RF-1) TaxID=41431 RepID=B7JUG3_RIPO1|nr:hypothetical protein [Rippkaea orientalis]ACK64543.1 TPR repeat-containing protein [Rippkaea orientalis PCC 8801]
MIDQKYHNPYLKLIEQLLSYPCNGVNQVLQENTELLNINLIESTITIGEQFLDAGDENAARYFLSLAQYIAQIVAEIEQQNALSTAQPKSCLPRIDGNLATQYQSQCLDAINNIRILWLTSMINSYKSA